MATSGGGDGGWETLVVEMTAVVMRAAEVVAASMAAAMMVAVETEVAGWL